MADKERTHGGYTQGRHKRPRTRFGGAATADSRHTADNGGQGLGARPQRTPGGHTADKLRDVARAYRGQPFFAEREPHSKLFGE